MKRFFEDLRTYFIGEALAKQNDVLQVSMLHLVFNDSVFLWIFSFANIVFLYAIGEWIILALNIVLLGVISVSPFMIRKTRGTRLSAQTMVVSVLLVSLFYAFYYQGKMPLIDGIYYAMYILFTFYILGIRWGFGVSTFILVLVVMLALNKLFEWNFFTLGIPSNPNVENNPIALLIAIVAASYCVYYFVRVKNWTQEELRKQNEDLSQKNQLITESLHYAERIQNSILPNKKLLQSSFEDCFILYHPKDIVSGDFFWIHQTIQFTFFSVIDCTGHGVPGAMMSFIGENGLRHAVLSGNADDPAQILNYLNEYVEDILSSENYMDGMDIAMCKYDHSNQHLFFSGANNPMYIIRNKSVEEYKAQKQPIGRYYRRVPYENTSIRVFPGDCIYLFSDGYADQFGGLDGKKFKFQAFRELLLDIHEKPMDTQKSILLNTLASWKGNIEQVDDICVMGIRV